jgi:RNA polymerase sigma factor (sigma-70 family)
MTNEELAELQAVARKGGTEGSAAIERFYKEMESTISMFVSITVKYIPKPLDRDDCMQEMRRIALDTFLNMWDPEKASFKTIFSYTRRRIINELEKFQDTTKGKSEEQEEGSKKRKSGKVISFESTGEENGSRQLADIIKDYKEQLPEERLNDVEMRETIKNALALLNDNERSVILLHYFDGELDYKEISVKLGRSYNNVKSDNLRALKKLMKILRNEVDK